MCSIRAAKFAFWLSVEILRLHLYIGCSSVCLHDDASIGVTGKLCVRCLDMQAAWQQCQQDWKQERQALAFLYSSITLLNSSNVCCALTRKAKVVSSSLASGFSSFAAGEPA